MRTKRYWQDHPGRNLTPYPLRVLLRNLAVDMGHRQQRLHHCPQCPGFGATDTSRATAHSAGAWRSSTRCCPIRRGPGIGAVEPAAPLPVVPGIDAPEPAAALIRPVPGIGAFNCSRLLQYPQLGAGAGSCCRCFSRSGGQRCCRSRPLFQNWRLSSPSEFWRCFLAQGYHRREGRQTHNAYPSCRCKTVGVEWSCHRPRSRLL